MVVLAFPGGSPKSCLLGCSVLGIIFGYSTFIWRLKAAMTCKFYYYPI